MSGTPTHRLQVTGITCQHCVKAITQAILAGDAAAHITVDLPTGVVDVSSAALPRDAIHRIIEEEGYTVVA